MKNNEKQNVDTRCDAPQKVIPATANLPADNTSIVIYIKQGPK